MYSLPLYNETYVKLLHEIENVVVAMGHGGDKRGIPSRVREFLFYLETKKKNDIKGVQTIDIIEYYEYLRRRPNMNCDGVLSESTIRIGLRAIRFLFEHLLLTRQIETTPCSLPRLLPGPFTERVPLSEAEIKILYKVANGFERAMLACAYGCGMRRSELAHIDIGDVVFGKREISVRNGKNMKSRSIPMAEGIIKHLKEYLVHERPKRENQNHLSNAFFLNKYGMRVKEESFNERYQELVKRTGNKELMAKKSTIHSLRHSIATHMIDRGADANYVRIFLGHESLDTTVGVYAKRRQQKMKLYNLFQEHLRQHNTDKL